MGLNVEKYSRIQKTNVVVFPKKLPGAYCLCMAGGMKYITEAN